MKAKQLPNPPEVIYFDYNTIKTNNKKNNKK